VDWYVNGADAAEVSELRREIVGYLARHAAEPDEVSAAELVIGEALSNVVRHAPGPLWVTLDWGTDKPTLSVRDLGAGFSLDDLPEADEPSDEVWDLPEHGRGLGIIGAIVDRLEVHARTAGGSHVAARLPVRRSEGVTIEPPHRTGRSLPTLAEMHEQGTFGKESFLRALVVQLANSVHTQHGPAAAEAAVAQVGIDVGGQMETAYRVARRLEGRLNPEEIADCLVGLKRAIDGGFRAVEVSDERIVFANTACPFGDVVRAAPALCRMTSSVFGGIAAANADSHADVVLEERIAVGDAGCRVVVYLDSPRRPDGAHRYPRPQE
jgi:anti-sigma regulatory factor (Ser/Thr protein kinase)/predicted ArsR family transcriptional regulator